MKLTSKELLKLVRKEFKAVNEGHFKDPTPTAFTGEPELEIPSMAEIHAAQAELEGQERGILLALADELTAILDKIEDLVPNIFGADRSPVPHGMSDDDIIDQERQAANEPPVGE